MVRLRIDLRSSNGSLFEERDFDSDAAAQNYYREIRANYCTDGSRVESRSAIMELLGGQQIECWSMRRFITENVKGIMMWRKKP